MDYPHYLTMALSKPNPVGLVALATSEEAARCMFESYTSVTNIIWLQDKPIIRLENDEGIVDVYRREWVLFLDSWITYLSHDDRGKCVSFRRDENGKVIDFRYYLCGCFV